MKGHRLPVNPQQSLDLFVRKALIGRKMTQRRGNLRPGRQIASYEQKIATTAKGLGDAQKMGARKVPFPGFDLGKERLTYPNLLTQLILRQSEGFAFVSNSLSDILHKNRVIQNKQNCKNKLRFCEHFLGCIIIMQK